MSARTARNIKEGRSFDGGVITSIGAQKKSQSRVNISIDGEYAFSLHLDVLVAEGLHNGQELTPERIEYICHQDDFHLARDLAFHFISYRPRSVHEVRRRLLKAQYNNPVIDRVISRLFELDMLDDEAFALEFVQGRLRNKGYGPRRITQDLKQRGVQDTYIEKALAVVFSNLNQAELAADAGKKIYQRLSRIQEVHVRRKKLSDYLARRGFAYEHMHLAIENLESHVRILNS